MGISPRRQTSDRCAVLTRLMPRRNVAGSDAAVRGCRVWLVNLYFPPSTAPTGILLESLARRLDADGYDVRVLTGRSQYNRGEPLSARRYTGSVRALLTFPFAPRRAIGRLLSWLTFFASLAGYVLTHRLPDKVVMMTTPPFLPALFAARNLVTRRPAELILWNQDTYPDVFAAVGLVRVASRAYRFLEALQQWGITRLARVIALDAAMAARLSRYGAPEVVVIPNWEAPGGAGRLTDLNPDIAHMLQDARRRFRRLVLYSGNYGWGHDLTLLWKWLDMDPAQRSLFFIFVGGGDKWHEILARQEALPGKCLEARAYLPRSAFEMLLDQVDFGLVCLQDECAGLVSPSKIHSYLSHGVPLLYLGPAGSNVAEAIDEFGCGFHVGPSDFDGLESSLRQIASDELDHGELRRRARRAAAERYSEGIGAGRLKAYLEAAG